MTFRIGKTTVRLDFRLLALLALYAFFDDGGYLPFSLAAAAVHESGHLAALGLSGVRAERVELVPGGMVIYTGRPLSLFVCAAGPLANILAAALLLPLGATGFGAASLLLGALSLMPAKPLDGYMIMSCLTEGLPYGKMIGSVISTAAALVIFCAAVVILLKSRNNYSLLMLALLVLFHIIAQLPELTDTNYR